VFGADVYKLNFNDELIQASLISPPYNEQVICGHADSGSADITAPDVRRH
jgi:hypothetical protein